MSDTSGLFKEENLTQRDHTDPDKHWIGESLPSPSVGETIRVGSSNYTGDSPFPARADHNHLFDPNISCKTYNTQGINLTGTFSGEATVCTRSIPAQPIAGVLLINAFLRLEKVVPGDVHIVTLYATRAGDAAFLCTQCYPLNNHTSFNLPMNGYIALPANTTCSITIGVLRNSGTGNATVYTNYPLNHIYALWVPTYT